MKSILFAWHDIKTGKNLDVYLAIIIALAVSILGIIGRVDQTIISSAILATLALVANGLLVNRRENDEIQKTLSSFNSDVNISDKFLKREYDRTRLRQLLLNSHEAFFYGSYLTTHIILLKDIIKERQADGLDIKFLLMDPSGTAVNMRASLRKDKDVDFVKSIIETNLKQLQGIADTSSKLKFRVWDYDQPYTIIAFDPHLPSGRMFVRLSAFDVPNERRPTFELTKQGDSYWFEFFLKQFESGWRESRDWSKPSS